MALLRIAITKSLSTVFRLPLFLSSYVALLGIFRRLFSEFRFGFESIDGKATSKVPRNDKTEFKEEPDRQIDLINRFGSA